MSGASAQRGSSRPEADPSLTSLYSAYAEHVRRHLSAFGVRGADLDDLCQEVFLVVTDKQAALSEISHMDLWLREICRKMAAGYRRRGFRQREVAEEAGVHAVDENAPLQPALLESREDAARLYRAVSALDDEAKDLIALHELGGLPLVDVAALVEHDRKTVRKRLSEAKRRLIRSFRNPEPARSAARSEAHALPEPAPAERGANTLQVLGSTVDISIGLIGAVLIAVWPGPPTLEALELLDEQLSIAVRLTGSGLAYLAIVEASTSTPSLEARKKIASMLQRHSKHYGVYPHVLLGGFSWVARPIMAGLTFLSGVPVPMPFLGSIERAAQWLSAGYLRSNPVPAADLQHAVEALREAGTVHRARRPRDA